MSRERSTGLRDKMRTARNNRHFIDLYVTINSMLITLTYIKLRCPKACQSHSWLFLDFPQLKSLSAQFIVTLRLILPKSQFHSMMKLQLLDLSQRPSAWWNRTVQERPSPATLGDTLSLLAKRTVAGQVISPVLSPNKKYHWLEWRHFIWA